MSPGSRNSDSEGERRRLERRRAALELRARVIRAVRRFFFERGFLEVETPHLIPAPAPEAHIDAVRAGSVYLHTSPELCMKRLLAGGFSRIFQICKCFRQGERGTLHLPEFTLLEWYREGAGYAALMGDCESLIRDVSGALGRGERITYRGGEISLRAPWKRMTVEDAFERYGSMSLDGALETDCFDVLMVEEIEPQLDRRAPVFLYEYPASQAALAKVKADDPRYAERFELYMGGLEIANAFSELTDAEEQRKRFERELGERHSRGRAVYPLPERFLTSLERMPRAAGIALGIDRLVMLFADRSRIDDVVTFVPEDL
jgi:lysyl-tRNA synthetase class 2